ncbi:hypothetical protein C8F01DRAFT_496362 [Mycena amicta]|nr:hypothetical protein C8F01DRAFT_496362 [Mycena amicta]
MSIFSCPPTHAQLLPARLEPLLYRTLITDNSSKGHALKQFIYTKPSGFFREHTHNLYLTSAGKWSEDYVRDLLQLCPQLTALAVSGIWGNPQQELVKQIGGVRRWSGFLYSLFGTSNLHAIDFSRCACFSNVTHMDIFDTFEDDDDLFICPALAGLPALTHLCLMDATPSVLTLVAEACPRLQVLVYMPSILDEARAIAEEPPFAPVDPRFVVSRLRLRLFWADWELFGTSAGFWAAADAFVARKRKGEINGAFALLVCTAKASTV